jgi:hypothetical protein
MQGNFQGGKSTNLVQFRVRKIVLGSGNLGVENQS